MEKNAIQSDLLIGRQEVIKIMTKINIKHIASPFLALAGTKTSDEDMELFVNELINEIYDDGYSPNVPNNAIIEDILARYNSPVLLAIANHLKEYKLHNAGIYQGLYTTIQTIIHTR